MRTRTFSGFFLLFAVLAPLCGARAEYAVLRNGQRLHITGYEHAGATIRLHVEGGTVSVPAESVIGIEPEEIFPPLPPPTANHTPFSDLIRAAAERHGVDERLVSSLIAAESKFNPRAVSRKQARGLMQLMPETAARFAVQNLFDPAQNIEAGTRYLKELLERYHKDPRLALAAYNAGPESVGRYRGVPPFPETQAYVRQVLQQWQVAKREKE